MKEALNLFHYSPSMRIGVCSVLLFLQSTIISLVLITLRERLLSWHHTARSLTSSLYAVSSLSVIRPTAVVIGKLNDGAGVVPDHYE